MIPFVRNGGSGTILSRLPDLRVERITPFLVVLLEVLWAYLWLVWISGWDVVGWDNPPVSLGGAVAIAVASQVVTRFSLAREWSLNRARLVVLSAAIILLAFAVRLELSGGHAIWDPGWGGYALDHLSPLLGGLVFGAYLLWRGISVGSEGSSFDNLYQRFIIGLAALVLLLVLWGATSGSGELDEVLDSAGLYIAAYFFVGLLALALGNFQSIREQMERHGEASGMFNRRWISLLLGVVLAIVVISLGIASLFSFDLVKLLAYPLNLLADGLYLAFYYGIALPLAIVAAGLLYAVRFLISLIGGGERPQPFNPPDLADLRDAADGQEAGGFPSEAALALKWGLVALGVLLVLFVLSRAVIRYWRGKVEEEIEEVNESLWSWEVFKADLYSFLVSLLRRFRKQRPAIPVAASPPIAVAQEGDRDRTYTVREIYQGLLWEGGRVELPRRQPETPYEYRGKLESRMETEADELRAITEAYVAERYGGVSTGDEQLRTLNRLWRRLRSALRGEEA